MASDIQGKYFSFTTASAVAGEDLMTKAKALTGETNMTAKKLTLISSGSLSIDVGGWGVYSTLYQDADLLFKLSLDSKDCMINSLVLGQTTASPIFLAMVY